MRVACVGQLGADRRERADRRAELLPLEGVAARRLVGALGEADGQRGDADAAGVEHLQRLDEALALLADQLVGRDAAVLEQHLGGLAGPHAELVFLLAGAQARRAALDDERRDALGAAGLVGHRHHDQRCRPTCRG